MVQSSTVQRLLGRFEHRLNEHAQDIAELRVAGVSEQRIAELYPTDPANYTLKLGQALASSKIHSKVRPIAKPFRGGKGGSLLTYSLRWDMAAKPSANRFGSYTVEGFKDLSLELAAAKPLVAQLMEEHPAAYPSADAALVFASVFCLIPQVLTVIAEHPEARFYLLLKYPLGNSTQPIKVSDYIHRVGQVLDVLS